MFDKFGEFDSAEEINRAAAAQLKEGDTQAILDIAKENGIDKEDAQDFINGDMPQLVNTLMAAIGKINVESKELELGGVICTWRDLLLQLCSEDEEISKAVRRKGKKMSDCFGELLKYSFNTKIKVHDSIVKAAGLKGPLYLGIPTTGDAKKIIREYYMK